LEAHITGAFCFRKHGGYGQGEAAVWFYLGAVLNQVVPHKAEIQHRVCFTV